MDIRRFFSTAGDGMKKLLILFLFCSVCQGDLLTSHLIPNTTDLLDIGTTGLKWKDLYLSNDAFIDTMTIEGGRITDSTGAISFGNENLTTTGALSVGTLSLDNLIIDTMSISSGSITDTTGNISFGNENLTTTGDGTFGSLLVDDFVFSVSQLGFEGKVGVGTNQPSAAFNVEGQTVFNDRGNDVDFRIEGLSDRNLFFVDASTDRIGVGTNLPNQQLEITGNFRLPITTATTGIIYEDANTLIHTFGATDNFFAGQSAGNLTMSGALSNTGIGQGVLASLTDGDDNFAGGEGALSALTTGLQNVGIGTDVLSTITTGDGHVALGFNCMKSATDTAVSDVAVGHQALFLLTDGSRNIAVGANALRGMTTQNNNTAIGHSTLEIMNGGSGSNTAVGHDSMDGLGSGSFNTAVGAQSMTAGSGSGDNNTAFGYNALASIVNGNNNTAIGFSAGSSMSTTGDSIFLGYKAGINNTAANRLIIDNQDRGSDANEAIQSAIYGIFNATPLSQSLAFNVGSITLLDGTTLGLTAGPILTFDDTNDILELTGARYIINRSVPTGGFGTSNFVMAGAGPSASGIVVIDTNDSMPGSGGSVQLFCDDGAVFVIDHRLGYVAAGGSTGAGASNLRNGAGIDFYGDGTWEQDVSHPSRIEFNVTDVNEATRFISIPALVLKSDGKAGFNEEDPATQVEINGTFRTGDGGSNTMDTDATGNTFWRGTSGLIYGTMFIPGVDIVVDIGGADPCEIFDDGTTSADDGWSAGELNEVTFPTGGTEHYLTVPLAGKYEVVWSLSGHTGAGGATGLHAGVMIDNVALRDCGEAHRDVSNSNDDGNMASACIIDCPNGTEEISLWVTVDNSNDFHAEHGTMVIKLIGGT